MTSEISTMLSQNSSIKATELKEREETGNRMSTPDLLLKKGYSYISMIGEGSNGKTYKGRNLKTGEIVAIKALKFSNNLKNYELFKREADVLKSISNPGVPRFYDYIAEEGQFTECWLVQEYIQGRSLLDMIQEKQATGKHFSEIEMLKHLTECAEIIQTLQMCYMPPIIHRDIKPSNILIRETEKDGYRVCLIDFGAVANPERRNVNSTVAGTVGYMPPEQLIGDCAIQSDYYALGATALHMLTGIVPSDFPSDGFTLLYEDKLKSIMPNISEDILYILKSLLAPQIADRPHDAEDLVKMFQNAINKDTVIVEAKKKINKLENILNVCVPVTFTAISIIIFILPIQNIIEAWIGAILFIALLIACVFTLFMGYTYLGKKKKALKKLEKRRDKTKTKTKKALSSPSKNQNGNTTTATVCAVYSSAIEFYFEVNGKAIAYISDIYQPSSQYKAGDIINIKYHENSGKYYCNIL